jgi:uncharacterized repeat protein (TIGR01451 family)
MKRFGVQLAASGIVILLGALGVAQAQRDSRSTESTEWEQPMMPALTPPPAPISAGDAISDDASAAPGALGFGGFGLPPADSAPAQPPASQNSLSSPVRTVGHEEPIAMPSEEAAAAPAYGPATEVAASSPNATISLPGWAMPPAGPKSENSQKEPASDVAAPPSMSLPGFGQLPANGMNEPAAADPSQADPQALLVPQSVAATTDESQAPAADYGSMPTIDFAAAPPNGLRDSSGFGSDPTTSNEANADSAPATMDAAAAGPGTGFGVPEATSSAAFANAEPQPIRQLEPEPDAIPMPAQPEARVASLPQASLRNLAPIPDAELNEIVLAEPGDRRLEGVQSPSVVIQKRAPEEVKVGKPASFVIHVQNVGGVEALGVRVLDRVPVGMRLVDASPSPAVEGDLLTWELGALEPGGERTITMQLIPEREGELGSVARVTFEAAASVRTISTRPELKISQRAPEQVLIGQQLEIEIEVSNPGTGAATGVILQEDVPEGLEHPKGRQLDNVIGTLAPGEVRRQVLRLRAVAPGQVENHIRLIGDDGLETENSVVVQVVAPELAIELEGPSRRFLERQAVFNINLANVGTADATNVEVVAYLDRGFSFVGTEYQGQYDPDRHAVYWSLAELPAEGRGSVPLRLLPIEQGDRAIRLEATGDLNVVARHEKNVSVDTLAELTFSITDDADPIEVGSEATYEIRISNRGSRDDSDVKMQMLLPPGLELVSSEAEASTDGKGLIAFAPTAALPAGSDTVHRVRVRGVAAGTHVVKAIVTSAQATVPVTKEESTMVYADQ